MTVLSKGEFVTALATKRGTTKKDAASLLDDVFAIVEDTLYGQQKGVKLGDVGTLKVDVVPEREHGIPKSDEKIVKPEHYAVKFKVNSAFKRDLADVEVEG